MIIRMTVGDNDFTQEIESFTKSLLSDLLCGVDEEYNGLVDIESKRRFLDRRDQIRSLLNPNNGTNLSKFDRKQICEEVKHLWIRHVRHRVTASARISDVPGAYLIAHFKVSVIYQMTDKWENGEVVYFFTTNNKFISQ